MQFPSVLESKHFSSCNKMDGNDLFVPAQYVGICSLVFLNPNISFTLVVLNAVNTRSSDGKWDYFFVRRDLSEKSRRTPNGFWKEVGEVETINTVFLGGIIGFKRSFVFVEGTEDDPGAITRWEMAEYRLNQERHLLRNDDNPEVGSHL